MDNGNDHVLQDAIRTATALKYGISGPIAAADLVWQQKKNIGMILGSTAFLLILPVLFLCMLPAFIFGSFNFTTAWNDNAVLMQNIQRYQTAVWSAIDEAHDDLLREIEGFAEEGEEITIIDDFNYANHPGSKISGSYGRNADGKWYQEQEATPGIKNIDGSVEIIIDRNSKKFVKVDGVSVFYHLELDFHPLKFFELLRIMYQVLE